MIRSLCLAVALFCTARLAMAADPWCPLDYANLAFHEAGHLFFRPFGSTLMYMGGTLGQLLAPGTLCLWFLRKEERPEAGAWCGWWVGENLVNISRYMADARELELPLVGGGDHDWNELFYRFGLLGEPSVAAISTFTHHAGVLVMILGLAWAGCFALPGGMRESLKEILPGRLPRALLG